MDGSAVPFMGETHAGAGHRKTVSMNTETGGYMSGWLRGRIIAGLTVMLLFACGLAASLWHFGWQSSRSTRETSFMYLTQEAVQCAETFRSQLNEKVTTLEIIADYLSTQKALACDESLHFASIASHHTYLNVRIVTPQGIARNLDGEEVNIADRSYFLRALEGKTVISSLLTSRFDGSKVFVIAVPIKRAGQPVGVLTGSVPADALHNTLDLTSFGGRGFITIIESDGNIVLKSETSPLPAAEHFFLTGFLSDEEREGIARMRRDMQLGHSGTLRYSIQNNPYDTSYVPVGINDWYVLSMVPGSVIDRRLEEDRDRALWLSLKIVVLFLGVFVYIYRVRRRYDRNLQQKHNELQAITDNVVGGVLKSDTDASFTLEYMSSGYLDIMGCTREVFARLYGDRLLNTVLDEDRARVETEIREQMLKGRTLHLEYRSRTADGRTVWFYYRGRLVREGDKRWCYAIAFDATLQHETMAREKLANQRYRFIMDQNAMVIFEWDIQDGSLSISAGWLKLVGDKSGVFREKDELLARVYPSDRRELKHLFRRLAAGGERGSCEIRMAFAENYTWYRVEAGTLFDSGGKPFKVMGLLIDINSQKQLELTLRDRADRDSGTGLYNKETTRRLVEKVLWGDGRTTAPCALLIVDLDNFKLVNDTQGHAAGDTVIRQVAEILRRQFRQSDIVGRIGGDEFAICVPGLGNREFLTRKVTALHEQIASTFASFPMEISVSIGVAISPDDDTTFSGLYRKADGALYRSKRDGKGRLSFFAKTGTEQKTGTVPD